MNLTRSGSVANRPHFGYYSQLPTGAYWSLLGPTGAYWGLLGPTGAYWGLLGPTGAYWGLLVPTGDLSKYMVTCF
jgi:hypothetical protein